MMTRAKQHPGGTCRALSLSISLARSICPEFFLPSALNTSLRPSCEYYYTRWMRGTINPLDIFLAAAGLLRLPFLSKRRRVVQRYLRVSL